MPDVLIDAHVHLRPGEGARGVLLQAAERMAAQGGAGAICVTMLAEQPRCDAFEQMRAEGAQTAEAESLWIGPLLLIAGRQVVSAEGIEILAQATSARFDDGAPARRMLSAMARADALTTLPWGVGKWLGRRGRLVDELLAADGEGRLLLGDNGGRPGWWRESRFAGRIVLRGSDPLPIAGDERRIGAFGSVLNGEISRDRPAADLRALIRSLDRLPASFGRCVSPLRFVSNQLRLRMAA